MSEQLRPYERMRAAQMQVRAAQAEMRSCPHVWEEPRASTEPRKVHFTDPWSGYGEKRVEGFQIVERRKCTICGLPAIRVDEGTGFGGWHQEGTP